MSVLKSLFVFLFYTIGILLIAVPFFIVSVVAIIAYPLLVIYKDILLALGLKKR